MTARIPRPLLLVATALFALSAPFLACSNYGEGERCDPMAGNNGNDDCQEGLRCWRASEGLPFDMCCPIDRSKASPNSRCATGTQIIGDSAAPPDTCTETDAGEDAQPDAVPDALPDGEPGGDSGGDAAEDGPGDDAESG